MDYTLQFPLRFSFEQLLALAAQLPRATQRRLGAKLLESDLPAVRMKTIAQVRDQAYRYPRRKPQKLVGLWAKEDEAVLDTFLKS
jgi:hypothetical protein